MGYVTGFSRWVAVTALCLLVILLSFNLLLHVYHPEVSRVELVPLSEWIWHYLLADPMLHLPNTNQLDIHARRHLLDIKRLLGKQETGLFVLMGLSILALLPHVSNPCRLRSILKHTGIAGAIALLIVAVLGWFWFLNLFNILHQLFFPPNSWIFAADSELITLFPLSYFQHFFLLWLLLAGAAFALMLLISYKIKLRSGSNI